MLPHWGIPLVTQDQERKCVAGIFFPQLKTLNLNQAPVAHPYNPSFLGGRAQEDGGQSRQILVRPYLKNTQHKKGQVE
jgi:hypothetical protein